MGKKKNNNKRPDADRQAQKAQKEKAQKDQVKRAVKAAESDLAAKAKADEDDYDLIEDEDAEHLALKEAVEAARESAAVLREAANALSQSAAQSVAVSRWGQFPGQNMGMPAAGMMPMLPPYYGDGMRQAGMEMPPGFYDDPRGRGPEMRDAAGYSPKEPNDARLEEDRGNKRWNSPIKSLRSRVAAAAGGSGNQKSSSDSGMLSGLPKFGDAPDPLPSPQEILASLPSFDMLSQPAASAPIQADAYSQPLQVQGTDAAGMPIYSDSASFQMDMPSGQIPPIQEQVIEIPAQEVVYGEVQMPDPYLQTYDGMQGFDPSTMYDPSQAFDPMQAAMGYDPNMQQYDPYAYGMGYDPYADPSAIPLEPPKGGKATASLILGILSILLAFIPPIGLVLAVIAVLLAKSYIKKGGMAPRAGTGRVCGVVGIVLSILLAIAIGVFVAYFVGGLYGETNAGAIMGYLQTTPLANFL